MRLRIKPAHSRLWIAHVAPYTTRHLARLLDSIKGTPELEYQVIGKSVQGRDIPLLTITDPGKGQNTKKAVLQGPGVTAVFFNPPTVSWLSREHA